MSKEIVEASVVKTEIVSYLGNILDQAKMLAENVKDDESAAQASQLGVAIKGRIAWLKKKREEIYEPLFVATEAVRLEYDNPIKLGGQLEKTLAASIVVYNKKKRDEEERLRLQAEAEARAKREEAARKEREAEAERQRIIKEREQREQKAREEAAAEARRKEAEEKARQQEERARIQREQDERAARMREEEEQRLKTAQAAHEAGLADKVEPILDKPGAIAPVVKPLPTKAEVEAEQERARLAEEKARQEEERERQRKAEEERLRNEEAEKLRKMQEDAERAKAEAEQRELEASARATVTTADANMRTSTTAKYEVASVEDFRKLVHAVAQNRAPIEWLNFDPEHPEKFRASAIGRHATAIKNKPDFAAKQAEARAVGVRIWLEEGGSFKADKTLEVA